MDNAYEDIISVAKESSRMEMAYLKHDIGKRLACEYQKYLTIQQKEPDMDYYDILLNIVGYIFKVLGKHGITMKQ